MAVIVLTNATSYVAGYDFTADTNEVKLTADVNELNKTNFRSNGWTELIGGVKMHTYEMAGFWQSATSQSVDTESFSDLGIANRAFTVAPVETETGVAYLFQSGKFHYEPFKGSHGEVAGFQLNSSGTDGIGIVRGQLAKSKGDISATGALGSVVNLGTVSSTQYLYATFHVFTAGTTITIQLQSDDSAGMGSPTTRATIGPLTTSGGTFMTRVAGPITDTHYRLNVSAITGTFNVAGAVAIQ